MTAWLAAQGYSGRRSGAELHARLVAAPPGVGGESAEAMAAVTLALVAAVAAIDEQAEALETRIAEQLARHPDAAIFTSLPRAGRVRAAALLAEIGDRRERFPTPESLACLAGATPSTRQSGQHRAVYLPLHLRQEAAGRAHRLRAGQPPGEPLGRRTSTAGRVSEARAIPTPCASSPGPGSTSSGAAGRTASPTTRPATAPSSS